MGKSTVFIEFMLSAIKAALVEADSSSDRAQNKNTSRWNKIQEYLKTHNYIMNADVRDLFGVSAATANRILAKLVDEGKLKKCFINAHWAYKQKRMSCKTS